MPCTPKSYVSVETVWIAIADSGWSICGQEILKFLANDYIGELLSISNAVRRKVSKQYKYKWFCDKWDSKFKKINSGNAVLNHLHPLWYYSSALNEWRLNCQCTKDSNILIVYFIVSMFVLCSQIILKWWIWAFNKRVRRHSSLHYLHFFFCKCIFFWVEINIWQ